MTIRHLALGGCLVIAAPVGAQSVLSGDYSVAGGLCAGEDCTGSEPDLGETALKLKANNVALLFEDTSTAAGVPGTDWRLLANGASETGLPSFAIENADSGQQILKLDAGAPENSIYVDPEGRVGLGTMTPASTLHIRGHRPVIKMQDTDWFDDMTWEIWGGDSGFVIANDTRKVYPFLMYNNLSDGLLIFWDDGLAVSPGDYNLKPTATLHVQAAGSDTDILVYDTNETAKPRDLLTLSNFGRPEIVLANRSTEREWAIGAGTNFVLKQGAVGSLSSEKSRTFEIKANGNAFLTGTLTTGGTTCGGGCDRVFEAGYDLPSIADHAEAMFALGHLPNVGPTGEGQPINVTDKLGRVLNELEHAHIYIAELEGRLERMQQALDAQEDRMQAALAGFAQELATLRHE